MRADDPAPICRARTNFGAITPDTRAHGLRWGDQREVHMRKGNESSLTAAFSRDPFDFFSLWPSFRFPTRGVVKPSEGWYPEIDVFEKDDRLVTKIDLPGMKKEDVKVEVTDGHLAVSGERKHEHEETKGNVYRCEREYGSFYRAVPLPDGVQLNDVKASFADGVLEVSVSLPAKPENKVRRIEIQDANKTPKAA
jgi:HSP20 family protein